MLDIRRRLRKFVLLIFAAIVATIAFLFFLLGIYLRLSEYLPNWQAALFVAGILIAFALILLMPALANKRRRNTNTVEDIKEEFEAKMSSLLPEKSKSSRNGAWKLIGAAAIIGIVLGRSTRK